MKNIIPVAFGILAMFLVVGNACAGTGTSSAGATLTINDTNGGGNGLQYSPSPGVEIGYNIATDGSGFALVTDNTKASVKSRMAYGVSSDITGYYQRSVDTNQDGTADYTFAAPSDYDEDAFNNGWSYVGGSGS